MVKIERTHDTVGAPSSIVTFNMQVAWRPRFRDSRVASVRLRSLIPIEILRKRGVNAELFRADSADRYDAVIFSKAYDEQCFREAVQVKRGGGAVVLDICDNHFYNPNNLPALRRAEEQFAKMLTLADAVVCSTDELAKVVSERFSPRVPLEIIADPVEREIDIPVEPLRRWWWKVEFNNFREKIAEAKTQQGATALVWFGIHGGGNADYGMGDLLRIRDCLEQVGCEHKLTLTVISNSRQKYRHHFQDWPTTTHYLEWRPTTFLSALRLHDIALIPVTKNPFTVCKSANRVALALSCGLAVVADAIPSYELFRGTIQLERWEEGIRSYVTSPSEREKDVLNGIRIVEERFTPEVIGARWAACIEKWRSAQPASVAERWAWPS